VWLCAPRWHDDPIFSMLIGGSGCYAVAPIGRYVWGGHYEAGTLIWRNRWVTDANTIVECRDALAMPADPARVVVLRQIEAVSGDARVRVVLDVRARFGAEPMRDLRCEDGTWTAQSGPLALRWTGAADARVDGDGQLVMELTVPAGKTHDFVLDIGPGEPVDPGAAWQATERAWRDQVPVLDSTAAPRDARHAYAVLRGLTSQSGGMVAAATMALPERAGNGASYDYRYAWVRDQCYAGLAVASDGPHPVLADTVRFVTARLVEDGPHIHPAYLVSGENVPEEHDVDLAGYPGGHDTRGNVVTRQFQLDTLGEVLQLYAAAGRHGMIDAEGWAAARIAVDAIEHRWRDPEAGIWELSNEWWTQSRLACVAGLRVAAGIAPAADAQRMRELADEVLAETSRRCLNRDGHWQRTPDDARVDASLLAAAVRGALPAADPRSRATLEAVRRDLVVDGYIYRFQPDGEPLGEKEGAFLLCGFLLSLAEHEQGEAVRAFRAFERSRAACGPPGLLAEEFDVEQRQLRGNLPQAFVHAALLECAVRLAATDESQ
jgi:GH15 family glucan-1,4-alpha-glucosidase